MTPADLHYEALDLCDRLGMIRKYATQQRAERAARLLNRAWNRADRRGRLYLLTCEACGRPTPMKSNGVGICCWGKE